MSQVDRIKKELLDKNMEKIEELRRLRRRIIKKAHDVMREEEIAEEDEIARNEQRNYDRLDNELDELKKDVIDEKKEGKDIDNRIKRAREFLDEVEDRIRDEIIPP